MVPTSYLLPACRVWPLSRVTRLWCCPRDTPHLRHTICTSSYPHLSNTREVGPCKNIFGQFLLTALWKWEENSHRIADDRGQELGIKRSCDDTEPRPQLDPARPRISASSHFSSVSFHHISSVSSRAAKTNDFHNRFHQQSAVSCEERRRSN